MSKLDKLISDVPSWQQVLAALAVVILMLSYSVYVIFSAVALLILSPIIAIRDGIKAFYGSRKETR
jgi:uncharacterized protein involved in cysteine biosynthesis